jgi:plasmid stabilization system protein ParE
MTYTVILSPTAERELDDAYDWLVAQTPQHGPLWYNGMLDAILALDTSPARHPLAPRRKRNADQVRQLLYSDKHHAYRILFIIRDTTVLILHIRHASRRNL